MIDLIQYADSKQADLKKIIKQKEQAHSYIMTSYIYPLLHVFDYEMAFEHNMYSFKIITPL